MRTATIHRSSDAVKSAIFLEPDFSSERTTVGFSPEISLSSAA
jgi:hypothetical protein